MIVLRFSSSANSDQIATRNDNIEKPVNATATQQDPLEEDDAGNERTSFEVMLQRARKRPVNPMYRFQVVWDAKVFQLPLDNPLNTIFTVSDFVLVMISSILLHANGFSIGLIAGKITARPLFQNTATSSRSLLPPFQPLPAPLQILILPLFWPLDC